MRNIRSATVAVFLATALLLSACGDDDDAATDGAAAVDDGGGSDDGGSGDQVEDDSSGDDSSTVDEPASDDDFVPPPDERTGTITVAGATTELGDDDFLICETVNPAFENDLNIIVNLDDGTKFRLSGTMGEFEEGIDGVVLGQMPDEEYATDVDVSREGRTVSGSAMVSAGEVEFSFTC